MDRCFLSHDKKKRIARCQVATPEDIQDGSMLLLRRRRSGRSFPGRIIGCIFKSSGAPLDPIVQMNAATMLAKVDCHQAEIDAACELIDFSDSTHTLPRDWRSSRFILQEASGTVPFEGT